MPLRAIMTVIHFLTRLISWPRISLFKRFEVYDHGIYQVRRFILPVLLMFMIEGGETLIFSDGFLHL